MLNIFWNGFSLYLFCGKITTISLKNFYFSTQKISENTVENKYVPTSLWFFKVLNIYFFYPYVLFIAAMTLRNAKLPSWTAMKTGIRHLTAFLWAAGLSNLKDVSFLCLFFHLCWRHERKFQHTAVDHWKSFWYTDCCSSVVFLRKYSCYVLCATVPVLYFYLFFFFFHKRQKVKSIIT